MTRPHNSLRTHLAVDVTVMAIAWSSVFVTSNITETVKRGTGASWALAAIATVVTIVVMKRRGLYAGRPSLPRTDEVSAVFVAALAGASASAVSAAFLNYHIGAWEILLGWAGAFSLRTLTRGLMRALATEVPGIGQTEKIVIVGTGEEACELANLIADHPESRLELVGVVGNLAVAERSGLINQWIGPTGRLVELMHQHNASGAIVTATGFRAEQFRAITRELFNSGYDVHLTTGVSRLGQGRFDVRSLSHEPLIVMARNSIDRVDLVLKRGMDIILATLALVIFSPIMALVAVAIWLEDRGPVTYTSQRAGRRGELFPMFKFRSMVTNADALKAQFQAENERTGPLFKMSNDPRITRVGKLIRETSLDELPQLINVLRGDMSLVGPRPALPEEQAAFDDELKHRFGVRPGITGLWQVEARSNASFNAYRRLDLHYVENWSLSLDLRILLATVEQVFVSVAQLPLRLIRRGAAANDGVTTVPAGETRAAAKSIEDVVIDLRERSRARMAAVEADNSLPAAEPAAKQISRRQDG